MVECIKNLLMIYGAYHVLKGTCIFIKDNFYPDNDTFILYDSKTGTCKKVNATSRKKKDIGKVIDIGDYK